MACLGSISSGTFIDPVASVGGAVFYNGTNYDFYSGPPTFSLATVSLGKTRLAAGGTRIAA